MKSLVVCPDCTRHIRRTEKACPFCRMTVTAKLAQAPERPMPTERLNRSALFAFAAAGIGAVACASSAAPERDDNKVIVENGGGGSLGPGGATTVGGQGGTAGGGGYLDHGNGGALYGAGGVPLGYGKGGTAGSGGRDAGSVPDARATADAGVEDGALLSRDK